MIAKNAPVLRQLVRAKDNWNKPALVKTAKAKSKASKKKVHWYSFSIDKETGVRISFLNVRSYTSIEIVPWLFSRLLLAW